MEPKRSAFVVSALTGTELTGGVGDAASIYSRLLDPALGACDPAKSTLIADCASKSDFETRFEQFLKGWDSFNQLILYFSGHGQNYKRYYCLFFGIESSTFITFRRILELLELHDVNRAIILLDSCYSGQAFSQQDKSSSLALEPNLPADLPLGIAMLTSSREFEKSKELSDGTGSVFTRLLTQALDTGLGGRRTKDGLIRLGDLVDHINQKLAHDEELRIYQQRAVFRPLNAVETTIWFSKNKSGSVSSASSSVEHPNLIQTEGELRILFERTPPDHHPCTTASFDDVDWELVRNFARGHKPDEDYATLSPAQLATKLNLFSPIQQHGSFHLHRTAVLCFGVNPEIHFSNAKSIFLIINEDNSEHHGDGKQTIAGPIPNQINNLLQLIRPHLDQSLTIDESGRRREYNEDYLLLREVVANALIHRSYDQPAAVQVTVHPRHIDITSPGDFPNNISWNDLIELANENERISIPVNMSLSYFMDRLKFYENVGRGFRIITSYIRKYGDDVITCRILPGPSVRIRVKRISHNDNVESSVPEKRNIPMQLPPPVTNFVGRDDILQQLKAWLAPGRIVSLWGQGGMGKTALAWKSVSDLANTGELTERFPDGIVFYSFYGRPSIEVALTDIAFSFGVEEARDPILAARRALSGKKALMILDGTEEAGDLQTLLQLRGGCGVLITTRDRSDVIDLQFVVSVEALSTAEAVALIQKLAGNYSDDLVTSTRICELLGNMPLAIRIAGRYMNQTQEFAADYLEWLLEDVWEATNPRNAIGRNNNLQRLMEKTYYQLSDDSKTLLAFSSFLGFLPFEMEAVRQGLGWKRTKINKAISQLIQFGLLLRDKQRAFRISHVLVYQFAQTVPKVESKQPINSAVIRFANYILQRVKDTTAGGLTGFNELDLYMPHIVSIIRRLQEEEPKLVSDLVLVSWTFLDIRGYWSEAREILTIGIQISYKLNDREAEVIHRGNLGRVTQYMGNLQDAILLHEEALAISREIGDRRSEGTQLGNLGSVYQDLSRLEEATIYFEQALAISREVKDRHSEGNRLGNLGSVYRQMGRLKGAVTYNEQALSISREIGDRRGEAIHLGNLGSAYQFLGDLEESVICYELALSISREVGDRRSEAAHLGNLGFVYQYLGRLEDSVKYNEQALSISHEIGDRLGQGNYLANIGLAFQQMDRFEEATRCYEDALNLQRETGHRYGEQMTLNNLGLLHQKAGRIEKAIFCYEQSLSIARGIGDELGEANTLGNLGEALHMLGRNHEALDYLEQAISTLSRIGVLARLEIVRNRAERIRETVS